MQITSSSIRKLVRANDEYAQHCERAIENAVSAADSGTPRILPRPYKQPASLWGRIKVALSGAVARRERACARLNALYSCEIEGAIGRDVNALAMFKFVKAYKACPNEWERRAMILNLRDDELKNAALKALGFQEI